MNDQTTPAFPQPTGSNLFYSGMTLRDYFAAKAMQAYLTSTGGASAPNEMVANEAYKTADAMLKAREQ